MSDLIARHIFAIDDSQQQWQQDEVAQEAAEHGDAHEDTEVDERDEVREGQDGEACHQRDVGEDQCQPDSLMRLFQCGGEGQPALACVAIARQVVDARIDGQTHRDAGDHGGGDVHGESDPAHRADHECDGEQVRDQQHRAEFEAAERDPHQQHNGRCREDEAGELVIHQALNQVRQQHEEAGRLGGGGSGGIGEVFASGLFHVADQFEFRLGRLSFSRAEDDAHAACSRVVEARTSG